LSDTVKKTGNGAILYDTAIVNQISEAAFDAGSWPRNEVIGGVLGSGGRGNTMLVSSGDREFVLRHYRRGGMPGRVIKDSYVWSGEEQTRSFAEWRLLHKMHSKGLPVPRPAAARYTRHGLRYTADLLTQRIPGISSLADRILHKPGDRRLWHAIGRTIALFHRLGICHEDLNAYNVQVDQSDKPYLLDFDRGSIRPHGVWQQKNMARLHRSLRKVKSLDDRIHFAKSDWDDLLEAYFMASRSA